MNDAHIKQRLNQVFREVFNRPDLDITEAMTADDIEEWDSLTHVMLIVASEKAFAVTFTTKEVRSLKNIGDFIALLGKHVNRCP
jgi:acyl carrier protein